MNLKLTVPTLVACAALAGCLGNTGSSLPPPSDVTAVEGDGYVGVTWSPQVGVAYLAVGSTNSAVTTTNFTDTSINGFGLINHGSDSFPPAIYCSEYTNGQQIPGAAVNGLPYYFTVDAHTGTAPGGPGSPTVPATPRAAGGILVNGINTWSTGNPMSTGGIQGVGYAAITSCLPSGPPTGVFTAVGSGGIIFTSPDARNWTLRSSQLVVDLYAVGSYTLALNNVTTPQILMVAVGAGGATTRSGDNGVTWSPGTAFNAGEPNLRAVTWNGSYWIAVGDGGRIQTSTDGITWTIQSSNTSQNLHAVHCESTLCVAVGDGSTAGTGTIDVLYPGYAWTPFVANGGSLRGVAYGNFDNNENLPASSVNGANVSGTIGNGNPVAAYATPINTWVVVGDNGTAYQTTAISSPSPTWTAAPITAAANQGLGLIDINYTTQFVAIDTAGNAYTSRYGTANGWSNAVPTGITDPQAMATNRHGYSLVGKSGDNAAAF